MRRLGKELAACATTIYWHASDKDELLDLAALDHVIGEAALRPERAPGASESFVSRRLCGTLIGHHGILPLFGTRATLGPSALAFLDRVIGAIDEVGFEPRAGAMVYSALVNYRTGYTLLQSVTLNSPIAQKCTPKALEGRMIGYMELLPADRFPNMVQHASATLGTTEDERFRFGLDGMLDGFEDNLARRRSPAAG